VIETSAVTGIVTGRLVLVGDGEGVPVRSAIGALQADIASIRSVENRKREECTEIKYPVPILTAYPAIARGAAKTNSEGGESFSKWAI